MHSLLTKLQNRMKHDFFGATTHDLLDTLETDEQHAAVTDFRKFLDAAMHRRSQGGGGPDSPQLKYYQ